VSRKPYQPTILTVLFLTGGVRKGYRAGLYLSNWLLASQMIGHEASLEEYGEWWIKSRATCYRERGFLAASLPKGIEPGAVEHALWLNLQSRKAGHKAATNEAEALAELSGLPWSVVVA
jgi:hypothetical protein